MGSGRWIRSLVALRPSEGKGGGGGSGRGRKWSLLWRSSSAPSGSAAAASEASETSSSADALSAVVAAVVRAPHRDFRLIRQEWAAVRIQTAFRAFLARRALKALRGIVRLQALVRGRLVRKQLAVTLKCMHALVRVQERARERRARMSADGRDSQSAADERSGHADPIKETEQRWCNSQGTLDEIRSKIHMTHEGAIKRERAIAYALSHQRSSNHGGRPSSPAISLKNRESSKSNRHWSYLEPPINAQCLKSYEELKKLARSKHSDATSVKVRRNNVTTRVAARAPSAPSASSSDFVCDESSPSTSSVTPASGTNFLASERRFDGGGPGYMSLTESAKARLTSCSAHRAPLQRQGSEDLQCYNLVAFSSIDAQSNAGSERSVTSKRLNSSSLKGWSMTRSLDKENDDRSSSLF